MNWYPQLQSGAVTQYPISRDRRWRVISNELEGGERVALADASGGSVAWKLNYEDLSDVEMGTLASLFVASSGRFGSFGFIDPLSNLLAGSENLSVADWRLGAMTVTPGVTDSLGATRGWHITNRAAGDQELAQTLSFPGTIQSCFSLYVRSGTAGLLRLRRDSLVTSLPVGPAWRRECLSGVGNAAANASDFAVMLSAGQSIDVWGMQVEAQLFPSQYKKSVTAGGVYPQTNFAMDELLVTSTAPGRSKCKIELTSRI